MKSLAVLLPLSFAIGAALSVAQPPAGSPDAKVPNPAVAQQSANAPRATVVNPAAFSSVGQAPSKAVVDALRPPPPLAAHDFGLTLHERALTDGVGALVCVHNRGNVPTPPAVVENLVEYASDGVSFSYREFPRFRVTVPSLRPAQNHCYNVPARRGFFQRVATRIEDDGNAFFDRERAEARAGAMRHPNSLPAYVIAPAP
ncbi:MAG: hypothetical protein EAZ43_09645 [Betaproteobacteria bacterium]|nr:MAG: hypothetical protein EAZ43_09645 [Betaproteobacteria bacterium]